MRLHTTGEAGLAASAKLFKVSAYLSRRPETGRTRRRLCACRPLPLTRPPLTPEPLRPLGPALPAGQGLPGGHAPHPHHGRDYKVYVDTKGNTQVRSISIV